ncbi:hypothetical protein ElyMa_003543700 [Elysia marginata]|uniref:Uncharacterized protein n=1 Tax=Elysia marginata TaxID=1093978 RepID=A0AAV4EJH5_9GAST|nr:hypothetical protein ElyMa_003543700 [Elysia marginata]
MQMHATNNKNISILVVTMLHITSRDKEGKVITTKQMVYITNNSEKLFLIRGALVDLHIMPKISPRYRYKLTTQGYIALGGRYTRQYDEVVAKIPNKTKCVNDALLWADTLEESCHQSVP